MRAREQLLTKVLGSVPMFSDLSPSQRATLQASASVEEYERGAEIFSAGQPAESFLVVLSGSVKVYLLSPDGREQILHVHGPGDLVAEGAVFAGRTYPASAAAVERSVVARLRRERLVELLRHDPELALAMIAGLSRRLKEFVVTIGDLALRDVTARLARFLLDNARNGFCSLPGTKTQLAAQLGTVLEPLSRSLRRLKDHGAIREEKGGIRILDEEALRALVEGES